MNSLIALYESAGTAAIRKAYVNPNSGFTKAEFMDLADHIASIVSKNLELLRGNLKSAGFQFGELPEPANFWAGAQPVFFEKSTAEAASELEKVFGTIPPFIKALTLEIGGVNFLGHHPHWPETEVLDPFYFEVISPDYVESLKTEKEEHEEDFQPDSADSEIQYYPAFAPDNLHKANISGGAPYRIKIPDDSFDGLLIVNEQEIPAIDYMKLVFAWGGFPGLETEPGAERESIPLKSLTKDLVPLK